MCAAAYGRSLSIPRNSGAVDEAAVDGCRVEEATTGVAAWHMEARALLSLAVPLAATNLCGYAISLLTMVFLGR